MKLQINVAVEGYPDEAVARKVCQHVGLNTEHVYKQRGKGNLDKKIKGYNNAAKFGPWLVLRDMDHDAECPPELKQKLLPKPSKQMVFGIAVREIEAWIMADSERLADFLSIRRALVPVQPESLEDPKSELVRLAGKSRKRDIREDMVPRPESGASEGPAYASRLAEFAANKWRPGMAAGRCESLKYCIERLKRLKTTSAG